MNPEILEAFLGDARDLLEQISTLSLTLERNTQDKETINGLFRAVHNLKGASGFLDAQPLTEAVHAAEDLLGAVRDGEHALSANDMDLLLETMDQVSTWLDEIEQDGELGIQAVPLGQRLVSTLRTASEQNPATTAESETETAQLDGEAPASAPASASALASASAEAEATDLMQAAVEILTDQRRVLLIRPPSAPWLGRIASVITVLRRLLPRISDASWPERIDAATDTAQQSRSVQPLIELIDEALGMLPERAESDRLSTDDAQPRAAACADASAQAELKAAPAPVPEATDADVLHRVPEADRPFIDPRGRIDQPRPAEGNRQRALKVDAERIDELMDLVGELIVAKNALPFLAKRAGESQDNKAIAKEIKSHFAVINRIADDMQCAVMQVRMVPVGNSFQRFPRLVRDCSRKLGKDVDLVIEGEETEADKNVVADLSDPLMHLVRNALDHGLEPPQERRAAGKPEQCRLQIRAQQFEDRILIEVSDDGRGIDPQAVKRKAYQKGLVTEEALEQIGPREALQLVFEPGFSTAQTVSDLSGRGVGMDVVRSAVQRAGGEVSLHSQVGQGTTVCLSVPLSMTVTQVMLIGVGGEHFGLVFDSVREILRLPAAQIQRIKMQETAVLRDRLLPLYRLDQVLGIDAAPAQGSAEDLTILVIEIGGQALGLIVDEVCEGVDVILKPLEGVMAQFPIYSGTALLGDGRVLLVLNIKELLRCL